MVVFFKDDRIGEGALGGIMAMKFLESIALNASEDANLIPSEVVFINRGVLLCAKNGESRGETGQTCGESGRGEALGGESRSTESRSGESCGAKTSESRGGESKNAESCVNTALILPYLRTLENLGAKITLCGTCVEFFGVKERLLIGQIGNAKDIAKALLGDRVVAF